MGAKVRITARAIDKFVKRERRYVRHEVLVEDIATGVLYFRETRDILSRWPPNMDGQTARNFLSRLEKFEGTDGQTIG